MVNKKLYIIILICIVGFQFTFATKKTTPKIYIIFNSLSCHECNIQLNDFIMRNEKVKRKCSVLPFKNATFIIKSAKKFYPELNVSYSGQIISLLPDSLTRGSSLEFPFMIVKYTTHETILTYKELFGKGKLDTVFLGKTLEGMFTN